VGSNQLSGSLIQFPVAMPEYTLFGLVHAQQGIDNVGEATQKDSRSLDELNIEDAITGLVIEASLLRQPQCDRGSHV
jgi:hypothetical protein